MWDVADGGLAGWGGRGGDVDDWMWMWEGGLPGDCSQGVLLVIAVRACACVCRLSAAGVPVGPRSAPPAPVGLVSSASAIVLGPAAAIAIAI